MLELSPEIVAAIKSKVATRVPWAKIATSLGVPRKMIAAVLDGQYTIVTLYAPPIRDLSVELEKTEKCPRCGVLCNTMPPTGWPCWGCRAGIWKAEHAG